MSEMMAMRIGKTVSRRWHYLDPALLWLYPATYLVHLAEEFWAGGGFVRWLAALGGTPFTEAAFVLLNLLGLALVCLGVVLVSRDDAFGWVAIALATAVVLNALGHLAAGLLTASYSPGMVTGVVLWLPLGGLSLLRAGHQASRRALRAGLWVGLLATIVVLGLVAWPWALG